MLFIANFNRRLLPRLQMQSTDKDFRFMATNDLMSELQKDSIKLDDDSERKVVKMLLRLLEDKNGEVQNLAVKWYFPTYFYLFPWLLHKLASIVRDFHKIFTQITISIWLRSKPIFN